MPVRYFLGTNMASYAIKGKVPHVRQRLLRVPHGRSWDLGDY